MSSLKILILSAILIGSLSSCGKSDPPRSGSVTRPSPPPPPPPPHPAPQLGDDTKKIYETLEYYRSYALSAIKASGAYAKNHKGQGILIAMIDSGIEKTHAEFNGRIHPKSKNIVTNGQTDFGEYFNSEGDGGHGTNVAGIMVANRDEASNNHFANMHGIAYQSQLLVLVAASKTSCESTDGCSFLQSDMAKAVNYANIMGARVINISLGGDDYDIRSLTNAYKAAVEAGMVIVLSAGNIDEDSPAGLGAEPEKTAAAAWASWSNGQIIVAGAIDQNNLIANFSYKAGEIAKDVYLSAPGVSVLTTHHGNQYARFSGTSAAAPVISAAVAVVLSNSPNLSGRDAVKILFETATDLGDAGHDVIYGSGLINLEKALSPVGVQSVMVEVATRENSSQNYQKIDLSRSDITQGGAFGSLNMLSSVFNNVMIFDKYNRSFSLDMSGALSKDFRSKPEIIHLNSFLNAASHRRHAALTLGLSSSYHLEADFYWQKQSDFLKTQEEYSPHLKMQHKAMQNFRFKMTYGLRSTEERDGAAYEHYFTFSRGMSVNEVLNDYNADHFLVTGHNDFTSLLLSENMQLMGANLNLSKSSNLQIAMTAGGGKREREANILSVKIKNRFLESSHQYSVVGKYSYKMMDGLLLGANAGFIKEDGSVLGSKSYGALSLGRGAETRYGGLHMQANITSSLKFFAKGSLGNARIIKSGFSLFGQIKDVKLSSFSLGISGNSLFDKGDGFTIAVSQPLKVTSAFVNIFSVAGRDYRADRLNFNQQNTDVSPVKSEIDLEFTYQMAHFRGGSLLFNLLHQFNPGHDKFRRDETTLLIRFSSKF
jgi:hypothetical protein